MEAVSHSADYSSPEGCHTALLQAVKTQDPDLFLSAFHPETLLKMFPDFDVKERAGAALAMVQHLNELFEHYGYPVLGRQREATQWMKVFEYMDHSNAENCWATFAYDPGSDRWLLMD